MGIVNCQTQEKLNPLSSKIFKIRKVNNENESNQNSKFSIFIYDIENKKGTESPLELRIFQSMEGLTDLKVNNSYYLCGNPNPEDIGSSFFIRIEHTKKPITSSILISTINHHYNPAMLGVKNTQILVIGGKGQKSCECYSIVSEKWKQLPNLPDERYKCSLCFDKQNEDVYLFGGYNGERKKMSQIILRINAKYYVQWDTIILQEHNGRYIERLSPCLWVKDNGTICILGGKNQEDQSINTLVEINIKKKNCKLIRELNDNVSIEYSTFEESGNYFYFFDNFFNIKRINKESGEIGELSFDNVFQSIE